VDPTAVLVRACAQRLGDEWDDRLVGVVDRLLSHASHLADLGTSEPDFPELHAAAEFLIAISEFACSAAGALRDDWDRKGAGRHHDLMASVVRRKMVERFGVQGSLPPSQRQLLYDVVADEVTRTHQA